MTPEAGPDITVFAASRATCGAETMPPLPVIDEEVAAVAAGARARAGGGRGSVRGAGWTAALTAAVTPRSNSRLSERRAWPVVM